MADILYEISGGFFDSVNQDRTYSAEQMNMPYKRIVTDGIFPDQNGNSSEDFIVRPDGGMYVSVNTGNALVGGKWAELDSVTVLHVPQNTSASGRIDSIILRADTSVNVRAVCIVYRQGTEAASPTAPALESNENVTELRLADIAVGAGVSAITAANITDQRGGAECPWVAGAIPPTQAQVSEAVEQYLDDNPGIFVIDDEFSDTSENAVANKKVTAAISGIQADITGLNERLAQVPFSDVGAESDMTDTAKIYRYDGALWFYDGTEWAKVGTGSGAGGAVVVTEAADMVDHSLIYLYEGTETGYTAGHFYYYNGSAWIDGGLYYVGKDGKNGTNGTNGQDGFSPVATVETTSTGVRISITDKSGTTSATVQNGTATDAQVEAWFDNHPEATTTVEDGSISKAKLAADVLEPVNKVSVIEEALGTDILTGHSGIVWTNNKYFDSTGALKSSNEYAYTESYLSINLLKLVKKVDLYTRYIACCVFYDGNYDVVGVVDSATNGGFNVRYINAPDGAVYFRLSQPKSRLNSSPITFMTLEDVISQNINSDLPVDIASVLTYTGGIKTDGTLSDYSSWKVTDFIKVTPGEFLKYFGCGNIGGNATFCPIAFYDADKNPLSVVRPTQSTHVYILGKGWLTDSATGTSMNFGYIHVPKNASYCRVSGYNEIAPHLDIAQAEPWAGKKCVFFGDSITAGIGSTVQYANVLASLKGIHPVNYGVNGSILVDNGMSRVTAFVTDYADNPADAFIFAYGTNDWGGGKPLGEWYTTDSNGVRTLTTDTTTFRGAWVQILTYLKTNFDGKKIILMTPIHRGDDLKPVSGRYLEEYVNVIKEAGEIFSVDVIDLYGESGLTPDINPNTAYFTGNDRLHPNAEGHKQMARVISAKMGEMTI